MRDTLRKLGRMSERPIKVATATKDLHGRIKESLVGLSQIRPEESALAFYLSQHAWQELERQVDLDQPLTKDQIDLVYQVRAVTATESWRMFMYLSIITAREFRHFKYWSTFRSKVLSVYGPDVAEVLDVISGATGDQIVTRLAECSSIVDATRMYGALSQVFHEGKWSSAFGGKAWGGITDCLLGCLEGKYSPEIMADQGFALAHNNGPIFNKGYVYQNYGSDLLRILDVQRAGRIPFLIHDVAYKGRTYGISTVSQGIKDLYDLYRRLLKVAWDEKVDWTVVTDAGAMTVLTQFVAQEIKYEGGVLDVDLESTVHPSDDPTLYYVPGLGAFKKIERHKKPKSAPKKSWQDMTMAAVAKQEMKHEE